MEQIEERIVESRLTGNALYVKPKTELQKVENLFSAFFRNERDKYAGYKSSNETVKITS